MYAYPKPELHLLLNSHHSSVQDIFFKFYSVLAEWPLYVVALLPLLWKKARMTLFFASSELTGAGILQIMKHIISADRPVSLFENYPDIALPLVEGVDMHYSNSFPSGHASTFFMFSTCCAIILAYHYSRSVCCHSVAAQRTTKPHSLSSKLLFNTSSLLLLLLAALGAYSRVYLSQHFLSDVCVGSIIGFATPFLMFHIFKKFLIPNS